AVLVEEADVLHAARDGQTAAAPPERFEDRLHLERLDAVPNAIALDRARAEAPERLVGPRVALEAEIEEAVLADLRLVRDDQREIVGAPRRRVETEVVVLAEQIVPERVDADRRLEAEVDERGRDDARLLVGAEGEEVDDRRRPLVSLRGRHEPA